MRHFYSYIFIIILLLGCNYKRNYNSAATAKQLTIAILPYKGVDTSLIPFIEKEIQQFYHCKTLILQQTDYPAFAFYEPRNRYKADSLLVFQKHFLSDTITSIVGLCYRDISTAHGNNPDWGIFGLGYCPGRTCIISTFRLMPTSSEHFRERLT